MNHCSWGCDGSIGMQVGFLESAINWRKCREKPEVRFCDFECENYCLLAVMCCVMCYQWLFGAWMVPLGPSLNFVKFP